MAQIVLKEIVPDGVDHQEALDVIISHFGGATSTPNHEVEVPHDAPCSLRIRTKRNRIVKIEAGPRFKGTDIAQLKTAIHEKLVDAQTRFVAANVFFSTRPIHGSFQCSDPEVQFLSAPKEAPRPSYGLGEHPFVVEFPCMRSADVMITTRRRMALVKRWAHVLNVVLASQITPLENRGRWSWVFSDPESPQDVRFAQHSYSIPNFRHERDDFSPALKAISQSPHDNYYTSRPALYGNEFAIPDSLTRTLNHIFHLPDDARRKFFRAAHWLFTANVIWQDSASAAFISTIAALESLMSRPAPVGKCSECDRDIGPGPTKLFRTFLDTYVPSSEVADILYRVRSNLAHGVYMLLSDTDPFVGFDTDWLREFQTAHSLSQVSRLSIINWLYAQDLA